MRRLFIIRKDLHLSPGKLAAMVSHCAEAYWTNLIRHSKISSQYSEDCRTDVVTLKIPGNIVDEYICGDFVKTICEAKNLHHLMNVVHKAKDLNLIEGKDYGFINDKFLTELIPENEDGTTTVGIWFKPLSDEKAHILSKKYQLYKGE